MPAKSYREILDRYDRAKAFGETKSLPEYAQHLNEIYDTQDFNEGLRDGPWTRFSTRLDQALEGTVGQVTGAVGEGVGSLFGEEEAGRHVGEGLPRMFVDMAPLAVPLVGPALTGLAFGGKTYADTGSTKAALISGAAGAVLPAVGKFGGELGARAFGGVKLAGQTALGDVATGVLANTAEDVGKVTAGRFLGSQAGQIGVNLASGMAQDKTLTGEVHNPFNAEFLLSQIPFTVFDAVHAAKAPVGNADMIRPMLKKKSEPAPVEPHIPTAGSPEAQAKVQAVLDNVGKGVSIDEALKVVNGEVPVVRTAPPVDDPMVALRGWSQKTANGKNRFLIEESDHPDLKQGLSVWVNGGQETVDPATGMTHVLVLRSKVNTDVQYPLSREDFVKTPDPNQPELTPREDGVAPTQVEGVAPSVVEEAHPSNTEASPFHPVEERIAAEMGVPPEELQKFPVASEPTSVRDIELPVSGASDISNLNSSAPTLEVKESIANFEQGKQKERAARVRATIVPEKPEDWTQVIPDVERAKGVAEQTDGTAAQKAEAARLEQATKEIDEALQDQASSTSEVHKTVSLWNNREQNKYGKAIMDETRPNKRKSFATRPEAEEWFAQAKRENPEYANYAIRDAGKTRSGKQAGYYFARIDNLNTSLDAARGDSGETLQNVVQDPRAADDRFSQAEQYTQGAEDIAPIEAQDRPKDSFTAFRDQIDRAMSSPRAFEQETKVPFTDLQRASIIFDSVSEGKTSLGDINDAIEKSGLEPFETHEDMQDAMVATREAVDAFTNKFRSPTLGSEVPFDAPTVEASGILKGGRALVDWIAAHPDIPIINELVGAFRSFPEVLDRMRFVLPGDKQWTPNTFFHYNNGDPIINVGFLPSAENSGEFARAMAHEVTHYVDLEASHRTDPAAVEYLATKTRILESMRNSKQIPKDVRAVIAKSVKENWYDKVSKEDSFFGMVSKSLGEDRAADWLNVIYGLQNEQELVAQSFSSHQFIALMRDTKLAPKGFVQSVLNVFSSAFSKLVGLKNDSALETLLTSFDNYLTAGNLKNTYNAMSYSRDALLNMGVRAEGLASRLNSIDRMYAKGNLLPSISGFVREGENGLLPATTNYGALDQPLRTALVSGDVKSVYDQTMHLLADQLPQHQELLFRMKQDLKVTRGILEGVQNKQIPGTVPEGLEASLKLADAKVQRMEEALNKQNRALERWNEMDGLTPQGWNDQVAAQLGQKYYSPDNGVPENLRESVVKRHASGKDGYSWWAKTFMLTQHFASIYESARTVVNRTFDEQGKALARAFMLKSSLTWNPNRPDSNGNMGSSDPAIAKQLKKFAASPKLVDAASDLRRWVNREGQGKALNTDAPFVKNVLGGLSEPEKQLVLTYMSAQDNQHVAWTSMLGTGLNELNIENTGILIASNEPGISADAARDLSKNLYGALQQASQPETAAVGTQLLQSLSTKMSPETYLKALQHAQALATKTAEHMTLVQKYPGYVSEQRYGKDQLVMETPDHKPYRSSGTNAELQKQQQELERKGYRLLDYVRAEDKTSTRFGMQENYLRQLENLDNANEVAVRRILGDDPRLTEVLSRMQRAGDVRATLAAASPLPAVRRRFVEGRETINMVQNAQEFYQRNNNWLRNRLLRAKTNLDMMHPEVEADPELRKYLDTHVSNFTTPDNALARKFVEATSFAKLGMDFGNSMIESTQHLTTGLSQLISETGSVTDAIMLLAKTTKALWQAKAKGRWDNPEHAGLADWLRQNGHSGIAEFGDIVDMDVLNTDLATSNFAEKAVHSVKGFARGWATMFSSYNDQIIGHAAFDIARSQGRSIEESYHFAREQKDRGLYTGGMAQRSVGLWSIKSRPVPQLLGALQSYTLGWFGQTASNYVRGFGKAPAGLTETQRIGAKKAFAYSLIAQAGLAGALGLPAVGQGLALFNQITGVDAKGYLRKGLGSLLDEDQEFGGVMTNLALRGVGAAGLPFDPSGRTSVSIPFVGVDAYKGFDVANLGGAVTSTAADFVKGAFGLLRGDTAGVAGMLPNVLKRPYQLWQGEGDVRDQRGGLLYKLSPAEQFWMAVGITPSNVQTSRDIADAVKKANVAAQKRSEGMADDIATIYRKQGPQAALQKMQELKQEDGSLDLNKIAQSVKNRVIAQTVPFDPRREVRPDADIYGLNTGIAPTEVARQQLGSDVLSSMGGRPSKFSRDPARLDAALAADPFQGLQQARAGLKVTRPIPSPYDP